MINQFNRREVYFRAFIFFVLLLIPVILFFSGTVKSFAESSSVLPPANENVSREKKKNSGTRWLTVNESELKHIQRIHQNKAEKFDLNIVEKNGGLTIIESDEAQILDLTRNMHQEFNKCAGFMAHETLEAARLSMKESLRAETNQSTAVYTIDNQTSVNPMLAETKETEILETITRLSTDFPTRRYDQPSGLDSANWIKNKWTALAAGRSDITVESFNHLSSPQPSIILTVRGTTLPDEVVVLGGHQDSINYAGGGPTGVAPGADDDASGIASLTEVIRVLTAKNFRPQRTVKFMAYAAEEIGLVGSNEIAADFQRRGVNVVGVLQLDMTNFKSASATYDIRIITDSTNAAQNQFLRDLLVTYHPSVVFADGTCGYSCSDHASWTGKGFAASFPFEPVPSNQTIHTTSDTLAQSGNNASHAVKYSRLAVSYIGELAKGTLLAAASYEGDVTARPNGDGAVSSTDVSMIQGFQLGIGLPYQSNEFQRADSAPFSSRGDGRISSIDVAQAQAYQIGLNLAAGSTLQPAGGPTEPAGFSARQSELIDAADLFELRIGDDRSRQIRVAGINAVAGQIATVPIEVDAAGDESVYGFSLNYDSAKLSNPIVSIGNAGGAVLSNTAQKGKISFSVTFGGETIAAGSNQRLVYISFSVASTAPSETTALTFTDTPTFNEVASKASSEKETYILPAAFSDGYLNISGGKSRKRVKLF